MLAFVSGLFINNLSAACGNSTAFQFIPKAYAHDNEEVAIVIHMKRTGYDPEDITIKQGDIVEFENIDTVPLWPASNIHPTHEIYSDFDPKKAIEPGKSWEFKFDQAGEWLYHDHIYSKLGGKIIVEGDGEIAGAEQNIFTETWCNLFGGTSNAESQYTYNSQITEASSKIFTDEDELYSYIKKFGTKKAMSQLYKLSAENGDCHEVAHEAGRISYEVYGNDVFQHCTADCHSGCYHGGTEAYFKENGTSKIEDDLKIICDSSLNPFFSHQCFHGIGHGLMAWRDYALYDALKDCEKLESGIESCYSGVFMENIVGGLSDAQGHSTEYVSDDPHYPCNAVDYKYKSSCYLLQTSRMMRLFQSDFAKIANACGEVTDNYFRNICFGSMGRDVSGMTRQNPEKSIELCQNASAGIDREGCLFGAVQDTFWTSDGQDTALKFCKSLSVESEKSGCYNVIFARAPQVINEKAVLEAFCEKAEEKYKGMCTSITGA